MRQLTVFAARRVASAPTSIGVGSRWRLERCLQPPVHRTPQSRCHCARGNDERGAGVRARRHLILAQSTQAVCMRACLCLCVRVRVNFVCERCECDFFSACASKCVWCSIACACRQARKRQLSIQQNLPHFGTSSFPILDVMIVSRSYASQLHSSCKHEWPSASLSKRARWLSRSVCPRCSSSA